jgi:hypothetical protein
MPGEQPFQKNFEQLVSFAETAIEQINRLHSIITLHGEQVRE